MKSNYSACWEASLLRWWSEYSVFIQQPCCEPGKLGPGVRLGQGSWQVIPPNLEREFLLAGDPAWWEPGWELPLHTVTLSYAPQEGIATPSQLEEYFCDYSRFFPLTSSSHLFPLLLTCLLFAFLLFTALSRIKSSSMSHLTGAGTGSFSREAGCTW